MIKRHLARHWGAYSVLLIAAAAVAVAVLFPVYFRGDDAGYISWARNNSLLDSFDPAKAELIGVFRPMQNLVWFGLYRLFELNPVPYQFTTLLLYGLALLFFFRFVGEVLSVRVAAASLVAYACVFYYLGYIVFWFSDFTYILELFFANLALFLFSRALNGRMAFFWSVPAFLGAILSKEPSAVLVPAVAAQAVVLRWGSLPQRRRPQAILTATAMGLAGALWLVLNASLWGRQGAELTSGLAAAAGFVLLRWNYYAGTLMADLGIAVWISSFYLAFRSLSPLFRLKTLQSRPVAVAVAVMLFFLLRREPGLALAVLLLAFVPLVLWRNAAALGAIWAVPMLLGIVTVAYILKTYLVEGSFGLAIIVAVAADDVAAGLRKIGTRPRPAWCRRTSLMVIAALVLAVAAAALLGPRLGEKARALRILSANRQNFGKAVSFISGCAGSNLIHVVVVDYEDMGLVYEKDIYHLSDVEKARRQKTMDSRALNAFLSGAGNIRAHNLRWLTEQGDRSGVLLMTMNPREEEFVDKLPLKKQIVGEWRTREERVLLFRIQPGGPDAAPINRVC